MENNKIWAFFIGLGKNLQRDLCFCFNEVEKYGCCPWIWSDYRRRSPVDREKKRMLLPKGIEHPLDLFL